MTVPPPNGLLPLLSDRPVPWLGGLSPRQFMRRYWQKKPLLVRGAFPSWATSAEALPVSMQTVLQQACSDRLPSRLVNAQYALQTGPLRRRQIPSLKTPGWTVLVQQVNTVDNNADQFLDHFRFVPEGRLDDLMISVASDQGGIGAHVDSYDVFLIQAFGSRRWELTEAFDPALTPGLELKILKRFKPQQTMVLGPGDLLYLPPGVAHRGTAAGGPCMTYSVGFRAPSAPEIADIAFGQYLDEKSQQPLWSDPWLEASNHGGQLPDRLVLGLAQQAMACLPTRREIAQEVVVALSAPHPSVYYDPPPAITQRAFHKKLAAGYALRLSPGSRLLFWNDFIAINGEPVLLSTLLPSIRSAAQKQLRERLETLANTRLLDGESLAGQSPSGPLIHLLWQWYSQGFVLLTRGL